MLILLSAFSGRLVLKRMQQFSALVIDLASEIV